MKNLFKMTTVLFLFIQTMGWSQTETKTAAPVQETNTTVETEKFKDAIGSFLLEEAGFELEIVQEDDKMYIITEFSKDILVQKNDTTLREPTRGVDLELIADNTDALKFSQNGYETFIKRVTKKD